MVGSVKLSLYENTREGYQNNDKSMDIELFTCWEEFVEEFVEEFDEGVSSGLWKYKCLIQWVAPTQLAVTHIVTHTPKYICNNDRINN